MTDVTISAGFSGRPYDLRMRVFTIENNIGGNYSRYRGDRYAYSRTGNGTYMLDCRTVDSWIAGYYGGGCYSMDFRPDHAGKTLGLGVYDTGAVGHAADGSLSFTARIRMLNASVFGSADTGDVWMAADHLPRPPAAPTPIGIDQITTTSFRYRFSGNWDGGSPITSWQVQIATNDAFTQNVQTVNSNGTTVFSPLTPATVYYARSRGNNAYWNGAWSTTTSAQTLPATAPGITPVTSLSGMGATVTMTPPAGGTPTKYTVERRLLGSGTAATYETVSPVLEVTGLTPGTTNEWRVSAWYGTTQSPWSAWVPMVQANPNTTPGDYFDGSTAAPPGGDVTYSWLGTVNLSASRATGVGVLGWSIPEMAGGVAVLQRVTGGIYGGYAARVIIKQDTTGPSFRVGQANTVGFRSAVLPNTTYSASIAVNLPRSQRMAAELTWVDGTGALVARSVGAEMIVPSGQNVTLTSTAVAPAGAVWALSRVVDVAGTGFSPWLGGESFLVDGGMITLAGPFGYFDGSFPDMGEYVFSWEGTPNNSISVRTTVDVPSTALIDPDCVTVPPPPRPPVVPNTCIDEVGLWRRHWYQVNAQDVREWFDTIPTVTVTTGTLAERQLRIRYYANPFNRPISALAQDDFCGEIIVSYLPPDSVLTLDGVTEMAWASVGGGENLSADHLLYGSDGLPAQWPVLECGIGYYITLDVPTDNPEGNVSLDFELVTRY